MDENMDENMGPLGWEMMGMLHGCNLDVVWYSRTQRLPGYHLQDGYVGTERQKEGFVLMLMRVNQCHKPSFWDWFIQPMVIWGMVHDCFTHITLW